MNNISSVLDDLMLDNNDDVAMKLASDFRTRRIEKNFTREYVAQRSGVAVSNIVRFERTGLISLKNLIAIAVVMGYASEIKDVFAEPKYSTMEELAEIRKNAGKKKAHRS